MCVSAEKFVQSLIVESLLKSEETWHGTFPLQVLMYTSRSFRICDIYIFSLHLNTEVKQLALII